MRKRRLKSEEKIAIIEDREIRGLTLTQLVEKYDRSKSTIFEVIKNCNDSAVKMASPTRKVIRPVEPGDSLLWRVRDGRLNYRPATG